MARTNVLSPTAGSVRKIEMKPGDRVEEDDPILILEAIKMEMPLTSDALGTLIEMLVSESDSVNEDQVVAVIETDSEANS